MKVLQSLPTKDVPVDVLRQVDLVKCVKQVVKATNPQIAHFASDWVETIKTYVITTIRSDSSEAVSQSPQLNGTRNADVDLLVFSYMSICSCFLTCRFLCCEIQRN
jgi:hypothetical protein